MRLYKSRIDFQILGTHAELIQDSTINVRERSIGKNFRQRAVAVDDGKKCLCSTCYINISPFSFSNSRGAVESNPPRIDHMTKSVALGIQGLTTQLGI